MYYVTCVAQQLFSRDVATPMRLVQRLDYGTDSFVVGFFHVATHTDACVVDHGRGVALFALQECNEQVKY